MPSFWSYIKNDKYAIGCSGQTVYVYDISGNELARFKDLKYAYTPMFCPERDMFVVKSTDGRLAFYSLDTMQLIKKFRFSKIDCSQDDSFCFSKDGKYFFNIERHIASYNSCLSVYEIANFNRVSQHFLSEEIVDYIDDNPIFTPHPELSHIEYDVAYDKLFVLGFTRGNTGESNCCFIAVFEDNRLMNITEISDEKFDYIRDFKRLEMMGFTKKAREWSGLAYRGYDLDNIDFEKLKHTKLSDIIYEQYKK